jgi:hypothetical protein
MKNALAEAEEKRKADLKVSCDAHDKAMAALKEQHRKEIADKDELMRKK